VGAPRKTVRTLNLSADVEELRAAAHELSKEVTKAAPSGTRWAHLTVDFTDPLLEPGCFFDSWLRSLGLRVDSASASRVGYPPAPGHAEGLRMPLLTDFERRAIPRAEDAADAEIDENMSPLDTLRTARAKSAALHQRITKHDKRLKGRRNQIIRALMGKDPVKWPEGYWAFALAAAAMWHRIPARGSADFVRPPELIAHTLAGWRYGIKATSVPKTLDRLHLLVARLGGHGAGPFDYEPIDQGEGPLR